MFTDGFPQGDQPPANAAGCSLALCAGDRIGSCLSELAAQIREINAANGWSVLQPEEWSDTYKIPGILALIHSEVSEALEAFRKDDGENFVEELADVLIRVLDCAGGITDDFDAVVAAKMAKNRNRGHRHGGKRV